MQDNQQNQYNQLNQQLLDQPSKPEIQPQVNAQMNVQQGYPPQVNAQMNVQQGYPPQINAQMNFPQGYQIPPNFPQNINITPNFPQNYPQNMPPNVQHIPKPEELFEMQKRMMAGERVNIFNPNQQSNAYVLPPQAQPVGDKLIIPFSNCKNIVLEVFMIISSLMIVSSAPSIGKIYTAITFLIEQILVLYFAKKRVEIVKDQPNNKLTVKLINYLGIARKKTEFDLKNVFIDIQIVDRKEGWQTPAYYRLIIINTFKDGIAIDLDSSEIKNTPLKIYDFYEHVNASKFSGQIVMKQTVKTFVGNQNDEENPLSFNINKYMNKPDNIFKHFNNFVNGVTFSKYVKMNEHFFSYYSKEPLKNKFCQGCLSRLIYLFHFYLFPLSIMSNIMFSQSSTSYNKKENNNNSSEKEMYFAMGFFGYIILTAILYFLCICIGSCCDNTSEYLRIDLIYSKNFDRLFIGIVKNDGKSYINTFLLNLNEIDRFVLQKNLITERGFHLKSISKGNGMIQDICYINEIETELEGLTYILNERLQNNLNNNAILNNNANNNIILNDINNVNNNMSQSMSQSIIDCPSPTPLMGQP